jgi:hypothetical protein
MNSSKGATSCAWDHHEADPGMPDERVDETGMHRFDLADRQPMVGLGQ